MFPRLGMVLLAQQIRQAQRNESGDAQLAPYPEEFGMLLRLGAVVVIGMGLVALVMTISL